MIITDLYQTKIECLKNSQPQYTTDIDSTNLKVVVSLIDFNGEPVPYVDVTLTVDKGYFNTLPNGNTGDSDDVSVTATTDSDGQISVFYTASEFGIATFRANTSHAQIEIEGYRVLDNFNPPVYEFKDKISLKYDGGGYLVHENTWTRDSTQAIHPSLIGTDYVTQIGYPPYEDGNDLIYQIIAVDANGDSWTYALNGDVDEVVNVYFEWLK